MQPPYSPDPPVRYSWASLLSFLDRVKNIVLDESLTANEAIEQLRAEFRAHVGDQQ